MTAGIIAGIIGLVAAAIKVWLWWRGRVRSDAEVLDAVLQHQQKVRLSIKQAEKVAQGGAARDEAILAGHLSVDDANKLRSGLPPQGG